MFTRFLLLSLALGFLCPNLAAKSKWWKTEIEGMRVYSESSENRTRKLLAELSDARGTLDLLFPGLVQEGAMPLNVYIFKSRKSFSQVAPLYDGKPNNSIVGLYLKHNYEGPSLIIVGEGETEQIRSTAFHEYVHHLLHQPGLKLPPWLDEGFAELFSTVVRKKDNKVVVGSTIPSSIYALQRHEPIPLKRFFRIQHSSHEYGSGSQETSVFYAQSWALTHFLMYGENKLPENAFHKLFNRAKNGTPIYEEDLLELLGVNYAQLEQMLANYCKNGKFTQLVYGLPANPSVEDAALVPLSQGEIQLLYGSLLLVTRDAQEAYPYLARASEALEQSTLAASFLGYQSMAQGRWSDATADLKRAIDLGGESPYLYLNYATSLLREHIPNYAFYSESINEAETGELLHALNRSRELGGDFSQELFKRFGEVILSSAGEPPLEQVNVLVQGHQIYPYDEWIALYIAQYLVARSRWEEARNFVEYTSRLPLDSSARELHRTLLKSLPPKSEG
ncbi:hypothetical protein QEH56_01925 [Pelagicoccus enzymogenes]|uniref:hypothetical protein n=1 Tax=Pelagicoccus enzymogenes TaxID=2773457 RepID=UPI00280FB4D6|nr:hypothetical protein [Pelagicoccus enzymogenes]MDQ8196883.1 hypothetical protein [Pelagicoccus enzymogenes]